MKNSYLKFFVLFLLFCSFQPIMAQSQHLDKGQGNPVIPGYFADPTVKKFGDTYYIYATTDGNGGGFGPSQVWTSNDFANLALQDMNWPKIHHYRASTNKLKKLSYGLAERIKAQTNSLFICLYAGCSRMVG